VHLAKVNNRDGRTDEICTELLGQSPLTEVVSKNGCVWIWHCSCVSLSLSFLVLCFYLPGWIFGIVKI